MTAESLADALAWSIPFEELERGLRPVPAAAEVLRLIRTDPPPELEAAMREWARAELVRNPEAFGLVADSLVIHNWPDAVPYTVYRLPDEEAT